MSYEYHVFLSHNSKDKPAVEMIAKALQEKYDLKCWLDKWNLVAGKPWQEELEKALGQCQTVAVFVGPNTISPWEDREMRHALEVAAHDNDRRVIPVLLPGSSDLKDLKLPAFLTLLTWVDFRAGLDDEDALYRLMCGIKDIPPGGPTIQLFLDGKPSEFSEIKRDDLERDLAAFLQVDRSSVKILNRIVEFSLTEEAATRLFRCFQDKDAHLKELGIISVKRVNRSETVSPIPPPIPNKIMLAWIAAVAVIAAAITLGVVALFGRWQNQSNTKLLWNFDQGMQSWQPENQSDAKPEAAALKVSLHPDGWLQGDFDFGIVNLARSNAKQPRATYFVPVGHENWSAFRTLMFDVKNPSTHDLKVIFSISDSSCWYEFGRDKILPQGQTLTLRFDLEEPGYKTCKLPENYENAAPPFKDVWRFDIIFLTPENPWRLVNGSVLIDNVKLTDRIPDVTN